MQQLQAPESFFLASFWSDISYKNLEFVSDYVT